MGEVAIVLKRSVVQHTVTSQLLNSWEAVLVKLLSSSLRIGMLWEAVLSLESVWPPHQHMGMWRRWTP